MKNVWMIMSVLLLSLLLTGCQPPTTEVISIQIGSACFLDESALPPGWVSTFGDNTSYGAPGQMLPGRALGGGIKDFVHEKSGARAVQTILLYSTSERATSQYAQQLPFGSANRLTPWREPSVILNSRQAHQHQTACAEFETKQQQAPRTSCNDIARYGEYLVLFSSWMSPEYMSDAEFADVLRALENRILTCESGVEKQ